MSLQDAVSKIVRIHKPMTILELGSGTGATSCRIAKENPKSSVLAVDMRDSMIEEGEKLSKTLGVSNVSFKCREMVEYVSEQKEQRDFVLLLYSFHHVPDPAKNKTEFLKLCKQLLTKKGKLCIADVFIPETSNKIELDSLLDGMWARRRLEAYSSVFWRALNGGDEEALNFAKSAATFSMKKESEAGELVKDRNNEYLVSTSWLHSAAQSIGYCVELLEPINVVGDSLILLSNNE